MTHGTIQGNHLNYKFVAILGARLAPINFENCSSHDKAPRITISSKAVALGGSTPVDESRSVPSVICVCGAAWNFTRSLVLFWQYSRRPGWFNSYSRQCRPDTRVYRLSQAPATSEPPPAAESSCFVVGRPRLIAFVAGRPVCVRRPISESSLLLSEWVSGPSSGPRAPRSPLTATRQPPPPPGWLFYSVHWQPVGRDTSKAGVSFSRTLCSVYVP